MSKKLHYIIPGNYVGNYQCFFPLRLHIIQGLVLSAELLRYLFQITSCFAKP